MAAYEIPTAATLVGVAGFQVWSAWNTAAPSFKELRKAGPDSESHMQELLDATLTVGTLALGLGVAFTIMTKDATALYLMLGILGGLALWSYEILKAEAV